jgi:hypothetical protein
MRRMSSSVQLLASIPLITRRAALSSTLVTHVGSPRVFDHITVRVSALEEARSFYGTALATLESGEPDEHDHFFEWPDLSIAQARGDRPVTRHVHIGLVAPFARPR